MITTGTFFNDNHPNLNRDWVVGDFVKKQHFNTNKFEFKWQRGDKGQFRKPKPVINTDTTSLAVLACGAVRLKFMKTDEELFLIDEGDYVMWTPDEPHEFEFLKDTLIITLRW